MQKISRLMGEAHKVRSFWLNLHDPADPSAVTIDTHAVGAGLLRPMSSESVPVLHAFGSYAGMTASSNVPVTRQNYIDLNWMGDPPDPWTALQPARPVDGLARGRAAAAAAGLDESPRQKKRPPVDGLV
jgi:hypothetical protein